ncbi:MAG: hypothetical protein AB4041_17480 [Microcystaceae cyanobacterium]
METNNEEQLSEQPSKGPKKEQQRNQDQADENDEQDDLRTLLPDEVIEKLPPETRKEVSSMMRVSMGMSRIQSGSSLTEQINSQHIDKLIDSNEKENEREYQRFRSGETTKRLTIGAILGLVLMVLVYAGFTKDKQISEKIITAGISALGGFGVGYAAGKKNN